MYLLKTKKGAKCYFINIFNFMSQMPWEGKVPQRTVQNINTDLGEKARGDADDEIRPSLKLGKPYEDVVLKDLYGPTKPDISRSEATKLFREKNDSTGILAWIKYDKQVIAQRAADGLATEITTNEEIKEAMDALVSSGELTQEDLGTLGIGGKDDDRDHSNPEFSRRKFLGVITAAVVVGTIANPITKVLSSIELGKKVEKIVVAETQKQVAESELEGASQKNLSTAWAISSAFFAIILSGITKPDLLPIGKETAMGMICLALSRNAILRTGNNEDNEIAAEELTELLTNFAIAAGLAELADLSNYVKIYVAKLIREYQPITETLDSIGRENIYTLLAPPSAENFSMHKTRETALQDNLTKLMGQIAGTAFVSSAVATTYLGASIVKNNTKDVFRLKYHQILQAKINSLYKTNSQITDEAYAVALTSLQSEAQAEAMEFMNGINGFVNIFSKTAGNLVPFAAGDPPLFFHYLEFKDELAYLAETFGDGLARGLILSLTNYIAFLSANGMAVQIPGFIKGNLVAIQNLSRQIKNAATNSTFRDLAVFEGDGTSKIILEIIKENPEISNQEIVNLLDSESTGIAVQITIKEKISAQIEYVRNVWKKLQKASGLFGQSVSSLDTLAKVSANLEGEITQELDPLIKFLQTTTPKTLSQIFDPKSGEVFDKIREEILNLQNNGRISDVLVQNLRDAQELFGQSVLGGLVYKIVLAAERGELTSGSTDLSNLTSLLQSIGPSTNLITELQKHRPLVELSIKAEIMAEAANTGIELSPEKLQKEINRRITDSAYQNLTVGGNVQAELAKALKIAVEKIGTGLSGSEGSASQADTERLLEHTGTEVLDTLATQIPAVDPLVTVVENSILSQLFPPKKHENADSAIAEMNAKIRTLFGIGAVLSGFADNVAAYLFMRKSIMNVIAEYLDLDDETRATIYKSVAKNTLFNAISAGTMSILGNGPTVESLEIGSSNIAANGDLEAIETRNKTLSKSIQSPITAATLAIQGAAASQFVINALAKNNIVNFVKPGVLAPK